MVNVWEGSGAGGAVKLPVLYIDALVLKSGFN